MSETPLVLLVGENVADLDFIRDALAGGEKPIGVHPIERVRTALARIAGGGVSAVLLNIPSPASDSQARDAVVALRRAAPDVPIVLLCEDAAKAFAGQLASEGALTYVVRSEWKAELKRRILAEIHRDQNNKPQGRRGTALAFLGAKGGVGTTTVALNVAAVLASTSEVIVAEPRSSFGSLCQFFRPHRNARGIHTLLEATSGEMDGFDVESCLWPNRGIPGLKVLFAPDASATAQQLHPHQAQQIVRRLTELGDIAVLDLPPELSDGNRAMVKAADTLALVVERDALAVDAAKAKLSAMEDSRIVPREAGLVVVNRVPLTAPLALAEIESRLGLPLFGVIPPAADLWASAYRLHTPVVKFDPQSLMATSLIQLANRFSASA